MSANADPCSIGISSCHPIRWMQCLPIVLSLPSLEQMRNGSTKIAAQL